jgi:hypothetical protein
LAGFCECGDEPSGSGATELVSYSNSEGHLLRGILTFDFTSKLYLTDIIYIFMLNWLLTSSDDQLRAPSVTMQEAKIGRHLAHTLEVPFNFCKKLFT